MKTAESVEITLLLKEILEILKAMKQQEFDYWEVWKKAKTKEQTTKEVDND